MTADIADLDTAHRQRIRVVLAAATVALAATIAGMCGITPATIFHPGGCPDSSPRPISATAEPVLQAIDGSELVAGGPRSVESLFDDRARGDALLQQATAHGATHGWTEQWNFADGDAIHADVTTFATSDGAHAFAEYEVGQGCPHTIATHDLPGTDVVVIQAERPGRGDGWEAVVVSDEQVVRLSIVSDDATLTLSRLEDAVRHVQSS
jgi:hypothetical protein